MRRLRWIIPILTLALLLGACGAAAPDGSGDGLGLDTHRAGSPREPDPTPDPTPDPGPDPMPDPEIQPADTALHSWQIETEAQARDYLTGDWSLYSADAHAEVLWLSLEADGTFTLEVDTAAGLWGADEPDALQYHYSGGWTLEPWEGEGAAYRMELTAEDTDDPVLADWDSLGVFAFEEVSLCDGQLLLRLDPLSSGETVLSARAGGPYTLPILTRGDDRPLTQTQRTDDTFYAHLWKSRYGCSGEPGDYGYGRFVVYADDLEPGEDFTQDNPVRESVPYCMSDDGDMTMNILTGGTDELFSYGDDVFLVTTDALGEIIHVEFVSLDPPPDEERAALLLEECDEVRLMQEDGMTMLFDGTQQVFERWATLVWLGTDHGDQFVREVLYAVTSDSVVYRFDAVQDEWYWIDPEAKG